MTHTWHPYSMFKGIRSVIAWHSRDSTGIQVSVAMSSECLSKKTQLRDHSHLTTMTWIFCVVRDGLYGYQWSCSHLMTKSIFKLSPSANGPWMLTRKCTKKLNRMELELTYHSLTCSTLRLKHQITKEVKLIQTLKLVISLIHWKIMYLDINLKATDSDEWVYWQRHLTETDWTVTNSNCHTRKITCVTNVPLLQGVPYHVYSLICIIYAFLLHSFGICAPRRRSL